VNLSSQIPTIKFDIVLANINKNVILSYLSDLITSLDYNCHLLLSGLVPDDKKDIVEACALENLTLIKHTERNNWISLLFKCCL
jgi:ribosomal protein L11 methyltransferase